MEEIPSMTPKTVACAQCGKTTTSTEGWLIRPTEDGEMALCPTCAAIVERKLEQQSQDINMARAATFGLAAAVAGAGIWYGLVILTDYKLGIVAIGVGWLVGRAVVLGAENKRSVSLQAVGGVLSLVALFLGEYLIINHFARQAIEGFDGWLSLQAFIEIYPQILAEGNWVLDVAFYLIAIYEGIIQPRPIQLRG